MSAILQKFNIKKSTPSDIYQHMDTLLEYAAKCETVAEFGTRYAVSCYALALAKPKKLLCLDISLTNEVKQFEQECIQEGINIELVENSSLDYSFSQEYDMLFIDTWHTYTQLSQELERHHAKIKKYMLFHDTVTYGHVNESHQYAEVTVNPTDPPGLIPAIKEFLTKNKNWKEVGTYTHCNGLTILCNTDNVQN